MRVAVCTLTLTLVLTTACGSGVPVGQFGPYDGPSASIHLPTGEAVTVYRLKYWVPPYWKGPAVQLEYKAPSGVSDTFGVHQMGRLLWPALAPYVRSIGVNNAFITATDIHTRIKIGPIWSGRIKYFTLGIERDSGGGWWVLGDPVPLLPPAQVAPLSILDQGGRPVSLRKND